VTTKYSLGGHEIEVFRRNGEDRQKIKESRTILIRYEETTGRKMKRNKVKREKEMINVSNECSEIHDNITSAFFIQGIRLININEKRLSLFDYPDCNNRRENLIYRFIFKLCTTRKL
jgi:hypothetical protein